MLDEYVQVENKRNGGGYAKIEEGGNIHKVKISLVNLEN